MSIALDSYTNGTIATSSGESWSHTCSGSNRILWVLTYDGGGAGTVTGVTYNGVSMTLLDSVDDGGIINSLWYLLAPATGEHTVQVVTTGGSCANGGCSSSYTGALQSAPTNHTNNYHANPTSGLTTTLSVSLNSWTILGGIVNNPPIVAGTGSTKRSRDSTSNSIALFDSNGMLPAGNYGMTIDDTGTSWIETTMAEFAPYLNQFTMPIETGSYSLDYPVSNLICFNRIMAMTTGAYNLAFQTFLTVRNLWLNMTKNSSTFSNQSKNSASWTNESKNTSTFTNQDKTK